MPEEPLPPLRIREADGSPNIIPVFDLILSNNLGIVRRGGGIAALTVTTGGGSGATYASSGGSYLTFSLETDLTAERNLVAGIGILFADSGANGNLVIHPNTALLVTTARTITTGNGLDGGGDLSANRVLGINTTNSTVGQMLISSAGTTLGGIAWVNTAGGGGGGVQKVRVPMRIMTVNPRNGNAFYTVKTGANIDTSFLGMSDLTVGVATYHCTVPNNVNATENWNIFFEHGADTGSGGDVALTFRGRIDSGNTINDTAPTILISSAVYAADSTNRFAVSSAATGVLDSTLGLAANIHLRIVVERSGALASDTVGAQWNLYNMFVQCDVDS